jgi:hypothetical protein
VAELFESNGYDVTLLTDERTIDSSQREIQGTVTAAQVSDAIRAFVDQP